jgi:hypothetical protein
VLAVVVQSKLLELLRVGRRFDDPAVFAWAVLRKISIRAHSWFNWLYPINF